MLKIVLESFGNIKDREYLAEIVLSTFSEVSKKAGLKEQVEICIYFIYWLLFNLEKEKANTKQDVSIKTKILDSISTFMTQHLTRVWDSIPERDAVIK